MKCSLCENEIMNYTLDFNQLKIDESHTIEICQECIDKFIKWQQKKFVTLFPTSSLKRNFKKEK